MADWRDALEFVPVGTEVNGTDISSVTTLTPAAGATKMWLQVKDQNAFIAFDNTSPAANGSAGMLITADDPAVIYPIPRDASGAVVGIKIIEAAATANIWLKWGK